MNTVTRGLALPSTPVSLIVLAGALVLIEVSIPQPFWGLSVGKPALAYGRNHRHPASVA